jgi:hypothetical protein
MLDSGACNTETIIQRYTWVSLVIIAAFSSFATFKVIPMVLPLVRGDATQLYAQDFTYHFLLSTVSNRSPYLDETRTQHISEWCTRELTFDCTQVRSTLPTGVSPIGFFLLFATTFVLGLGLPAATIAYALMVWISLFAWLELLTRLPPIAKKGYFPLLPLILGICAIASDPFVSALRLGQPSILVTALICLASLGHRCLFPLVLVMCSVKPHYFLIALGMLFAHRAWHELLKGVVVLMVLGLGSLYVYGSSIVLSYFLALLQYAGGMPYEWFGNSYSLAPVLGIAPTTLEICGVGAGALLVALSTWCREPRVASLLPVIYVLSFPYVANYELLLLIIPIIIWGAPDMRIIRSDLPAIKSIDRSSTA